MVELRLKEDQYQDIVKNGLYNHFLGLNKVKNAVITRELKTGDVIIRGERVKSVQEINQEKIDAEDF